MNYSSSGSGAWTEEVASALVNKFDCVRAHCLSFFDRLEIRGPRRSVGRIHDRIKGEKHIAGIELVAIVELHTLAKTKYDHRVMLGDLQYFFVMRF